MKIEINEQKILTEVLERDGQVHQVIKDKIQERLVSRLVDEIESKYISKKWDGAEEVADIILRDLTEKQTELVKKILKEFYDSYRYKKSDLQILKKLKEFIGEQS